MVKVAVVGARGYLGRELVRLLLDHEAVETVLPVSTTGAGEPLHAHVPSLRHAGLCLADEAALSEADVVMAAGPPGAAAPLAEACHAAGSMMIDLSRDHRSRGLNVEPEPHSTSGWHYGLADLWPCAKGATRITNPGCYPTASLLTMLPVIQAGLHAPGLIIVDGKSGVSGAGREARPDLHFPAMQGSTRAYKVDGHDHQHEIAQAVSTVAAGSPVRFTPHLVPQSRGLLATVYVPLQEGIVWEEVQAAYDDAFAATPFVHVVEEADTAVVAMSNHAHVAIHLDAQHQILVGRCAIDNLIKGGAGQAVQNMNHALGLDAATGLGQSGGGI